MEVELSLYTRCVIDKSAQLWEVFIDIEDLTLNSLHTRRERRTSDTFVLRLKHQCRMKRI